MGKSAAWRTELGGCMTRADVMWDSWTWLKDWSWTLLKALMFSPTVLGFPCLFDHRLFWIKTPVIPPFRGWLADTASATKTAKIPLPFPIFATPAPHILWDHCPAEKPLCCVMGKLVKGLEVCWEEKAAHGDHGRSPASQSSNSHVPGCWRGWHSSQLFIAMASLSQHLAIKASGGQGMGIAALSCKLWPLKTSSAMWWQCDRKGWHAGTLLLLVDHQVGLGASPSSVLEAYCSSCTACSTSPRRPVSEPLSEPTIRGLVPRWVTTPCCFFLIIPKPW